MPRIIHYCHSPTRYLHGLVTDLDHQNLPFLYRFFLPFFKWWLRLLDLDSVQRLKKNNAIWLTNSSFCQKTIQEIYGIDCQVIYPPIELEHFQKLTRVYKPKNQKQTEFGKNWRLEELEKDLEEKKSKNQDLEKTELKKFDQKIIVKELQTSELQSSKVKNEEIQNEDFYYYFGRISFHKRLDLVILACLRLGRKLKICGATGFGPEMQKLQKLVSDFEKENPQKTGLVEFLGRLENVQRDAYLSRCRAFIFAAKEDFGIAPVEVLASGVPIIAFGMGGALEYVITKDRLENLEKVKSGETEFESKNETENSPFDSPKHLQNLENTKKFENSETEIWKKISIPKINKTLEKGVVKSRNLKKTVNCKTENSFKNSWKKYPKIQPKNAQVSKTENSDSNQNPDLQVKNDKKMANLNNRSQKVLKNNPENQNKKSFGISLEEKIRNFQKVEISNSDPSLLLKKLETETEGLNLGENWRNNQTTQSPKFQINSSQINGVFFGEQSVESLCAAILEFEKIESWDSDFIKQSVARFDQRYFVESIQKVVNS